MVMVPLKVGSQYATPTSIMTHCSAFKYHSDTSAMRHVSIFSYCEPDLDFYGRPLSNTKMHASINPGDTPTYSTDLCISVIMKWLVSKRPYLKEDTSITPNITSCRVLVIMESLWCCPLDWDLPSMGFVVSGILQISRHPKVCNL